LNQGAGFFIEATAYWQRERTWMNGPLHAIHGTPPVAISVYAVGRTLEGSPPQPTGAVRQSPGSGAWNIQASGVTPATLRTVYAAPGTADAYAAGTGGVVLTNRNTVPVGSWADLGQGLTTVDLEAASGNSSTDVYFGGAEGTLLHYDGTNFTIQREFTDNDLSTVHGSGANNVVVGGSLGTIRAGDAAAGFAAQSSGTSIQISGIWVDTATNAYAVGTGGTILRYWDQGGAQPLGWYGETSPTFHTLTAVTGRTGEVWAVGDLDSVASEFTVLKDVGAGWVAETPALGFYENLSTVWIDPTSGDVFAAGENGSVIRWDASATAWINDTPVVSVTTRFLDVFGTGASNVLLVGEQGTLFHFDGSTWTANNAPVATEDLIAVWMDASTPNQAWIAGTSGTLYSLDLTTWTWTPASPSPTARDLTAVWGSSPTDVYVVGQGGLLLHYDGTAWAVVESGGITGLFALDATHIYAVGPAGLILEGDGAGNWTAFGSVPTTNDLTAVWAGSTTNALAVGKGGTVLHYDGTSWTPQGIPLTVDLYAVWGIQPVGPAWAGGDQGVILEDSGSGWDDASISPHLWAGTTDRITGLWATTATNVYACTLSGSLFHYTGGSPTTGFASPSTADSHAVRVLNVNGDAFPDLLFANEGQNTAWTNNGFGMFSDATVAYLPVETDAGRSLALGGLYNPGSGWTTKTSLDSDADADIVVGNWRGQNRLLIAGGVGVFTDGTDLPEVATTGLPAAVHSRGVALGDVNGDGAPDAVVARYGTQNRLFLGRGGGRFQDATASATAGLPVDADPTVAVALADVDGDNDLDVIFANDNAAQRLLVNDGQGNFTVPAPLILPADVFVATCCAVGDVDGDQVPDIVFGTALGQNRLYIQNAGIYNNVTGAAMPVDAEDTRACALVDIDGNGELDIVFANHGEQNVVYVNKLIGSGFFEDGTFGMTTHMPTETDPSVGIASGDVTGDGVPDLLIVNEGAQDMLLINSGTGYYTDGTDLGWIANTGLPAGIYDGTCAVFIDVDHDGDLDLVVGNRDQQNRLFLNDGVGEFTDGTDEVGALPHGLPTALASTRGVASADIDGDGDPDLFLANEGADEVLLNK
jgi:hypothetical protein